MFRGKVSGIQRWIVPECERSSGDDDLGRSSWNG